MDEIKQLILERDRLNRILINRRTRKQAVHGCAPELTPVNRRLRELKKLFPVEYQEAQYESTLKWFELYQANHILDKD